MDDNGGAIVPVWTLATGQAQVRGLVGGGPMTAGRLTELRGVLAALADQPIATLELHPLPGNVDRSQGIPLDSASPLAQHLSQLIAETARNAARPAQVSPSAPTLAAGEGLYRMVVPAKVADQFGRGVVRPMASKAAAGGIHGALRDSKNVVAQATFVPVGDIASSGAATAGAVGGAGATAGAAVVGGVTLTVAAPLVLMAVAVGASAAAERQRQQAIDHITELLEQLHEQKIDDERSELDGCRDAIDKATAILLDEGKLGVSLGLDSAVHEIGKALAAAERRIAAWVSALDKLPDPKAVDVDELVESFPGIDGDGGTFRGHLELAALAIALKRRVIVLQAVDHAQLDPGNLFENFSRVLKVDQERIDEIESGIAGVLMRLAGLELARPRGLRRAVVTSGEVDRMLRMAYRLHAFGDGVALGSGATDVAIEIIRNGDGSVVVLPALAA